MENQPRRLHVTKRSFRRTEEREGRNRIQNFSRANAMGLQIEKTHHVPSKIDLVGRNHIETCLYEILGHEDPNSFHREKWVTCIQKTWMQNGIRPLYCNIGCQKQRSNAVTCL